MDFKGFELDGGEKIGFIVSPCHCCCCILVSVAGSLCMCIICGKSFVDFFLNVLVRKLSSYRMIGCGWSVSFISSSLIFQRIGTSVECCLGRSQC